MIAGVNLPACAVTPKCARAPSIGQLMMSNFDTSSAKRISRGYAGSPHDGIVFGHDGGVQYDGNYAPSPNAPGHMDLHLRLIVPPGVELVLGVPAQPAEYRFPIDVRLPARGQAPLRIDTPYGQLTCVIRYLRPLPDKLAA